MKCGSISDHLDEANLSVGRATELQVLELLLMEEVTDSLLNQVGTDIGCNGNTHSCRDTDFTELQVLKSVVLLGTSLAVSLGLS